METRSKFKSSRARVRKFRAVKRAMRDFTSTSSDRNNDDLADEDGESNNELMEIDAAEIPNTEADSEEPEQEEENEGEESEQEEEDREELEQEEDREEPEQEGENEDYYSADESDEVDESEFEDDANRVNNEIVDGLIPRANICDQTPEIELLRKWIIRCNIRQSHVDELLSILRRRLIPDLPKSAKTFLATSAISYDIEKWQDSHGGNTAEFVYFGLAKGLKACVNTQLHPENRIDLQINIDGLPLYKSSSKQFWPILCKVHLDPDIYKLFPVAIYCGEEKPKSVDQFMEKFVTEVNLLQMDGITIDGKNFGVRIKCFIADTPARTFIKCVKGHGGYAACERCTIYGERSIRRMVYNSADCPERTDVSFRAAQQREHHHGVSPLTRIRPKINMFSQFILDFMHLCCLGVMKKLLLYWLVGNLNVRWSRADKLRLSERMKNLRSQTPCEFERKPRSIF